MKSALKDLGIKIKIETSKTDEEIIESYKDDMWYEDDKGKTHLNENIFAEAFRDVNHLRYNNGLFYTRFGKTTEELLAKDIWESIRDMGIKQNVEKITKKLLGAVKLASTVDKLNVNDNIIPFANGDFFVDKWEFRGDSYTSSAYRLPVSLKLELGDIPNFSKWLNDLFVPEDIIVIQEYLGYALVPTTKAQKALFLVGDGGAGKSVMGVILEALLAGSVVNTPNTQEFLQDKHKLPELEHKLVLYDDDLDSSALSTTGLYKKLITNTLAITADRKYGQPFAFTPYVRLIACCNKMLTSTYDQTDGFYRRLLPIIIKPKANDFVPDLNFYDKIRSEIEGILQWCLIGLNRLRSNNWVLSVSNRTKEYLSEKKSIEDHFPLFIEAVFNKDDKSSVSSIEIVNAYNVWCRINAINPKSPKTLQLYLSDNIEKLGIKRNNHIRRDGKDVRGFRGIALKEEYVNKIILS